MSKLFFFIQVNSSTAQVLKAEGTFTHLLQAVSKSLHSASYHQRASCCWILLRRSVSFNHMICFCFLSRCCHGNRVYGCPQQQVKHRTPKQKEESPPFPLKRAHFASTVFGPHKKNNVLKLLFFFFSLEEK